MKKLNLQLFAEEPEETPETEESTEQKPEDDKIVMTREEFELELQKVGDKRVSEAEKKIKERLEAKIKSERQEAEELAKLSDSERAEKELQKMREELESERMKLNKEKMYLETTKQLGQRELPVSFAELLVSADAETTKKNIDQFETAWKSALQEAVDKRITGTTPKKASGASEIELLKQQLNDPNLKLEERLMIKRKLEKKER